MGASVSFSLLGGGRRRKTPAWGHSRPCPLRWGPGCRGALEVRSYARLCPRSRPGQDIYQRLHGCTGRHKETPSGAIDQVLVPRPDCYVQVRRRTQSITFGRPGIPPVVQAELGTVLHRGRSVREGLPCSRSDAISPCTPPTDSRVVGNDEGSMGGGGGSSWASSVPRPTGRRNGSGEPSTKICWMSFGNTCSATIPTDPTRPLQARPLWRPFNPSDSVIELPDIFRYDS